MLAVSEDMALDGTIYPGRTEVTLLSANESPIIK